MKFLHSMIRVKDVQKSLDFYQNLLGLKLDRKMELKDFTLYFLKDEETGCEIELTHNLETPEGGYEQGKAFGHFAFETNNMNDFTEKLKANGYKYSREPFILPGHALKIAFVLDPDGNQIELIERK